MALNPIAGNRNAAASSRSKAPIIIGLGNTLPDDLSESSISATELMPAITNENFPSKRPYSAVDSRQEDDDVEDSDGPITDNCNVIRRKINTLINSGDMKVTEFQRACGINSNSYGRFMKLKGPRAGDMNQTYEAAFRFFERRKRNGIKAPSKKKVKKGEESKKLDVSDIKLDGEEEGEVEVYDTCDEIRRKIAAYLREPDVTQAGFLREIAKGLSDPTVTIQSAQLKAFQAKKGPTAGNTSRIFYASYVFFEKKRIQQKKPKSKLRLETEDAWETQGGIDTKNIRERYICHADSRPFQDKLGRVRVERIR